MQKGVAGIRFGVYIFPSVRSNATRSMMKWRDFVVNAAEVLPFLIYIEVKSSVESIILRRAFLCGTFYYWR